MVYTVHDGVYWWCYSGDSGEGDDPTEGEIVKLADDEYVIWCSGRVSCSGMLVHIKLSPRQDLFSTFSGIITQNNDTMVSLYIMYHVQFFSYCQSPDFI